MVKDGTPKSIEQLKTNLIRPLPGMSETVSEEVVSEELSMFKKAMKVNSKQGPVAGEG